MALTKITSKVIEDGQVRAEDLADNSVGLLKLQLASNDGPGSVLTQDVDGNLVFKDSANLSTSIGTLADVDISGGVSNDQVLKYDNGIWVPGDVVTNFNDLADVEVTGQDNKYLRFVVDKWVESDIGYADILNTPDLSTVAISGSYTDLLDIPPVPTFSELTNSPTPSAGTFLRWNGTGTDLISSSIFMNDIADLTPVAKSGSYDDLTDKPYLNELQGVEYPEPSPSHREVLIYDNDIGGNWVPGKVDYSELDNTPDIPANIADLSDVTNTTPVDDQILRYNGGIWDLFAYDETKISTTDVEVNVSSDGRLNLVNSNPGAGSFVIFANKGIEIYSNTNKTVKIQNVTFDEYNTYQDGDYLTIDSDGTIQYSSLDLSITDLNDVNINSVSNNQILSWNNTAWQNITLNLDYLDDVDVSGAKTDNSYIKWNTVSGNWEISDITLDSLPEFNVTNPQEGDVLSYTSGEWTNSQLANSIDGLSDVDTGGVVDGNVLKWNNNSGQWEPSDDLSNIIALPNSIDDLGDVTITNPQALQYLKYNGSDWINSLIDYSEIQNTVDNIQDLNNVTNTPPGNNQYLKTDGSGIVNYVTSIPASDTTGFAPIATSGSYSDLDILPNLNDLQDVTITSQQTGDTLFYNGSQWINQENTIKNLTDTPSVWTAERYLKYGSSDAIELVSMIPAEDITGLADIATSGNYDDISGRVVAIDDLNDVSTHVPLNDQNKFLQWSSDGTSVIYTSLSTTALSNDYNDLDNLPTIPVNSDFNIVDLYDVGDETDKGFLRWNSFNSRVDFQVLIDAANDITGLAPVALTGNYNDLSNLPVLEDLDNVSVSNPSDNEVLTYIGGTWTNNLTSIKDLDNTPNTWVPFTYMKYGANDVELVDNIPVADVSGLHSIATSGDYDDLINKPTNDRWSFDGLNDTNAYQADDQGRFLRWNNAGTSIEYVDLSDVAISGSYDDLSDTPVNSDYAFSELSDVGVLGTGLWIKWDGTQATTEVIDYTEISGLKTVSWTGDYNDLDNLPTIYGNDDFTITGLGDTAVSPVSYGFLRWNSLGSQVEYVDTIPAINLNNGSRVITGLSKVAYDGSYNDLSDLPVIPENTDFTFSALSDTPSNGSPNAYLKYNSDGTEIIGNVTTIPFDDVDELVTIAKSADYNDLLVKPSLQDIEGVTLGNSIVDKSVLMYQGNIWSESLLDSNALSDIQITTPTDNQMLVYDGANSVWFNKDQPEIPKYIHQLDDVKYTRALSDDQVLVYNKFSGDWENKALSITQMTDVADIAQPKKFLKWNNNGTSIYYADIGLDDIQSLIHPVAVSGSYNDLLDAPTNQDYKFTDLSDTSAATPLPNQFLRWNSSASEVVYLDQIPAVRNGGDPTNVNDRNIINLSEVAYDGKYNSLIGVPSFSDVAIEGNALLGNLNDVKLDPINPLGQGLIYSQWTDEEENTVFGWTNKTLLFSDRSPTGNGYFRWNSEGTELIFETSISVSVIAGLHEVATEGELQSLEDVEIITTPADGTVLTYDAEKSKWVPKYITGVGSGEPGGGTGGGTDSEGVKVILLTGGETLLVNERYAVDGLNHPGLTVTLQSSGLTIGDIIIVYGSSWGQGTVRVASGHSIHVNEYVVDGIVFDETGNISFVWQGSYWEAKPGNSSYVVDYSSSEDPDPDPGNGDPVTTPIEFNLGDLGDIELTAASEGQILQVNDQGIWENVDHTFGNINGSITEIDEFADTIVDKGFFKWVDGTVEYVETIPAYEGDPTDSNNHIITGLSDVAYNGSYNDLTDLPVIPVNLGDLGDAVITTPMTDDFLTFDGANWVNTAKAIPNIIDDIADVEIRPAGTPSVGLQPDDVLTWDEDLARWVNKPVPVSSGGTIIRNEDFDFLLLGDTSNIPQANHYLKWNSAGDEVVYTQTIEAIDAGDTRIVTGLGEVAYTNDYDDLDNQPTIPTNDDFSFISLSDTNDTTTLKGYLRWDETGSNINYSTTIPAVEDTTRIVTGLAEIAYTGSWNDLADDSRTLVNLSDTANVVIADGFLRWNSDGDEVEYQAFVESSDIDGLPVFEWTNINSDYVVSELKNGIALLVDTSVNQVVVTLPDNPEPFNTVKIADYKGTFSPSNYCQITSNWYKIEDPEGILTGGGNKVLRDKDDAITLTYIPGYGWKIIESGSQSTVAEPVQSTEYEWEIINRTHLDGNDRYNNLAVGEQLMVDVSGAGDDFIITLPVMPENGDTVRIGDYSGKFFITPVTIESTDKNIMSSSDDLLLTNNYAVITLTFIDDTVGWSIIDGVGEFNEGFSAYWIKVKPEAEDVNFSYQASNSQDLMIDTTENPVDLILPANPYPNSVVKVSDHYGTFKFNNCVVKGNGYDIENSSDDFLLDTIYNNATIEFTFIDELYGWKITNNPISGSGTSLPLDNATIGDIFVYGIDGEIERLPMPNVDGNRGPFAGQVLCIDPEPTSRYGIEWKEIAEIQAESHVMMVDAGTYDNDAITYDAGEQSQITGPNGEVVTTDQAFGLDDNK